MTDCLWWWIIGGFVTRSLQQEDKAVIFYFCAYGHMFWILFLLFFFNDSCKGAWFINIFGRADYVRVFLPMAGSYSVILVFSQVRLSIQAWLKSNLIAKILISALNPSVVIFMPKRLDDFFSVIGLKISFLIDQ